MEYWSVGVMDYSAPDIALFSFIDKELIQSLNFEYPKFIFFSLPLLHYSITPTLQQIHEASICYIFSEY
jgi:hypothetical protein